MICVGWVLEWLDSLITGSLNPEKNDLNGLSDEDIYCIATRVKEEKERLLVNLKKQLFSLRKKKHAVFLVNQLHSSFIVLMNQVLKHQKDQKLNRQSFGELYSALISVFQESLSFIELHFIAYLKTDQSIHKKETEIIPEKNASQKLLCDLSVDQMALLLRSAEDLKIITARSINSLFKTIVPHLSTPNQDNISPDSMRSKSYVAETRDKEIAIQALEKMIKRIKEY